MPGTLKDVPQAVTVSSPTAVPDVQWSGRIGRYVFQRYVFLGFGGQVSIPITLAENVLDDPGERQAVEKEIYEARTGDLGPVQLPGTWQAVDNGLGQFAWRHACRLAQNHGQVRGEFAIFRRTGPLQLDGRFGFLG